mgnify:CR=1 FL=1
MHGEYGIAHKLLIQYYGSPPHAWGIPGWRRNQRTIHRFTPTCMGNTLVLPFASVSASVHPHMHGEYFRIGAANIDQGGSPPHAWGILVKQIRIANFARFTPTCMGNTGNIALTSIPVPVHPHMHGEYSMSRMRRYTVPGSPPHAWGILYNAQQELISYRFTPTCMGNTSTPKTALASDSVHPHMHGEYT